MGHIGERIKQMRKHRALTQEVVADAVGVSKRTIIFWEQGKDVPSSARLPKLQEALGCNMEWLVNGRGEPYYAQEIDLVTHMRVVTNSAEQIIRKIVLQMPLYDNPEIPIAGMAAADEQQGREWDGELSPGETAKADAVEPRVITVRGSSAEEVARDGQQVVIDAGSNNVAVGELCVVLTRDGLLRLKRKAKDSKGMRRYESINRDFKNFEAQPRQVVAEFPVVTILIKAKTRSPVETADEGFPL